MIKLSLHLLSILAILAGSADEAHAQVPGSTPHTYPECLELGLTDQACHRQIVEAGGTARSSLNSVRTIVPKNFRGWSEQERWYRKYVEYCKRNLISPSPIEDVIHHYPGFPVYVPYYLVYP